MPCRTSIEDGLLRVELSGVLTPEDLVALRRSVESTELVDGRVLDRVVDLSGVTGATIAFPDIHDMVEHRLTMVLPNAIRSALVAPEPVQRGYARMFQTLNTHEQIEVRIFDDVEAALAWVRSRD